MPNCTIKVWVLVIPAADYGFEGQIILGTNVISRCRKTCDSETAVAENQGRSYVYAKRICVHIWTKNMGKCYHDSDGFFVLCVQNVCLELILISLNSILTEFVMIQMFVCRHPPINA